MVEGEYNAGLSGNLWCIERKNMLGKDYVVTVTRINSYLSTWKQTRKCILSVVTQGIFFFLVKRINKLGSGNDFEVFFQRLGIASGRARYSKNWVSLHLSNYISLAIA